MSEQYNFNKYIDELEENKDKLKNLSGNLEKLAEDINKMIPTKYDYKSRYILADRVQILSNLYDTILKYRSEIAKEIKEQVNVTKLEEPEDDLDNIRKSVINLPIDKLKELVNK